MTNFSNELRKIHASNKLVGIERIFDLGLFYSKHILSEWIITYIRRRVDTYWATDLYVVGMTILLAAVLNFSDCAPLLSACFASFILAGTIINMANVVFLSKVFGPPISAERTLLLFIFNVAQVVFTFAIWYRWMLDKQPGEALFKAILVFGTIGYPQGADMIVGIQIATDIFLLAIFLAFILGNFGTARRLNRKNS
ncbi:MAG TPA: hypothetical protein VKD19_08400 [Pseudolabrys sp.]|nr:hypothetical protein [Pseudolabrys sp.]